MVEWLIINHPCLLVTLLVQNILNFYIKIYFDMSCNKGKAFHPHGHIPPPKCLTPCDKYKIYTYDFP